MIASCDERADEQKCRSIISGIERAEEFTFSGRGGENKRQTRQNILVVRWDPDKIALHDLFCAGYMLCEMVVREEETQVSFIFDDVWAQAVKKNQAHIDVGKKRKFSLKPSSAVI